MGEGPAHVAPSGCAAKMPRSPRRPRADQRAVVDPDDHIRASETVADETGQQAVAPRKTEHLATT
jgi:hypothetical protein